MRAPFKLVRDTGAARSPHQAVARRLAYDPAAFGGGAPSEAFQAQYPDVHFTPLSGGASASSLGGADAIILSADAARRADIDKLSAGLREARLSDRVIVVLNNADLESTRAMIREGAADVLPAPVTEPALAASLDRLLARIETSGAGPQGGQVVAFLKAGGGSGATAMAVQSAAILASGGARPRVCVVDLDIQFGQAALYLDIQDAITMAQVLSAAGDLSELGFASALTPHASGARVLAAPPEFMPLESLTPNGVDALMTALRREFDIIILDLPAAWTAWSYRALRQADQIVLVTQLSVPHAHLAKRQLQLLETQRLDDIPLTLVCNRCGGDNPTGVSQRSVEAAIGRGFDVVAPEERRVMNEAINQGLAVGAVRRGSKLERALQQLAGRFIPGPAVRMVGK